MISISLHFENSHSNRAERVRATSIRLFGVTPKISGLLKRSPNSGRAKKHFILKLVKISENLRCFHVYRISLASYTPLTKYYIESKIKIFSFNLANFLFQDIIGRNIYETFNMWTALISRQIEKIMQ